MKKLVNRVVRANEFYLFLVIVLLALVIQLRSGQFFAANNLVDIANAMVVPGIFAIGAYLVIISGGIDVSFPALASLAVYATTSYLVSVSYQGSIFLPLIMVVALGALLGGIQRSLCLPAEGAHPDHHPWNHVGLLRHHAGSARLGANPKPAAFNECPRQIDAAGGHQSPVRIDLKPAHHFPDLRGGGIRSLPDDALHHVWSRHFGDWGR